WAIDEAGNMNISSRNVTVDSVPPIWNHTSGYLGSNTTTPEQGDPVILYSMWKDETALDWGWLTTNETGEWKNYTYIGNDYFSESGTRVPIYHAAFPEAWYENGRTYVVYQGDSMDPYATYYNHFTNTWADDVKVGDNPLTGDDSHGAPAMCIADDGYIHVWYGAHNSYLQKANSTNPYNISSWNDEGNWGPSDATYPVCSKTDNGGMYVFYRRTFATDNRPWYYKRSTDNGTTWETEHKIIDTTDGNLGEEYLYGIAYESGTEKIHLSWSEATHSGSVPRRNVYYAYLNTTDENLYNITGYNLGTTISQSEADASCLVFNTTDSSADQSANGARVNVDGSGLAHITFFYDSGTHKTLRFTKWNDTSNSWITPVNVTSLVSYANYNNFVVTNSTHIEIYTEADRGSGTDIERWVTTDGGETWSRDVVILTETQSGEPLMNPQIPYNYNPEFKVLFGQYASDTVSDLKVYAWGEIDWGGEGFLKERIYNSPYDFQDAANTWTWANFTWDNDSISLGTVCWKVYANDTSGNENVTSEQCFNVTDATPPGITIQNPQNITYSSVPIDLNITTDESVDWCGWNLNNTANDTMSGSGTTWWDSITCPEGTHQLYVYCNDSSGNMGSNTSIWFTYDTPPKYWDNSTNSTYAGEPVEFRLNWTDNTGLSGYIFSFCNGTWNGTHCIGSSPTWANSSFTKCKEINITNAGSSTLENFPVYINLTKDDDMLSDYSDLRFYNTSCDEGGIELDYEIENYTTDNAHIWARIPSLPTVGTIISVYYKNSTPIESGENKTGVWDSNYKAVYHMIDLNDSTINGKDLTNNGPEAATGRIGGCYDFETSESDYANNSNIMDLSAQSAVTIEAWFWVESWVDYVGVTLGDGAYGTEKGPILRQRLGTNPNGRFQGSLYTEDGYIYGISNQTSASLETWYYVTVTLTETDAYLYMDAIEVSHNDDEFGTHVFSTLGDDRIEIGRDPSAVPDYYDGKLDEVRISNTNRSADWINQTYQMVANQGSFVSFGNEEEQSAWQNDTWTSMTGLGNWSNVTKVVNSTLGATIAWKVYANDTSDNWNVSENYSFTTIDGTPPVITWEPPTPDDDSFINKDYVYLNTTITDTTNTSTFFDWNYSLMGYWSFEYYNSSGIYDNSTYNNFGTFQGTGFGQDDVTTGKYGSGLKFNGTGGGSGSGDCVVTSDLDITDEITVEFWYKPHSVSTVAGIIEKFTPVVAFHETWDNATDGYYNDSNSINYSDEVDWAALATGSYEYCIVANNHIEVWNDGGSGDTLLRQDNMSLNSTYNEFKFYIKIGNESIPGGTWYLYIRDVAGTNTSTLIEFQDDEDMVINGNIETDAYSLNTWFWVEVFVNYTSRNITVWSNGSELGTYEWSTGGTGTPIQERLLFRQQNGGDSGDSFYVDDVIAGTKLIGGGTGSCEGPYEVFRNADRIGWIIKNSTSCESLYTSNILTLNKWYHVVTTYNGSIKKIYINGIEEANESKTGSIITNNYPVAMGATVNSTGACVGWFDNSTIDEVRIHSRVLSGEEINASYNNKIHELDHNFTSLSEGTYDYTAWAIDLAGNMNTSSRNITVDTTPPIIIWESPTPDNEGFTKNNYVYLNTTITDLTNTSAFFDWNHSLIGYWNFEHVLTNGTVYDNSTYGNDGTMENFTSNTTVTGKYGKGLEFDGNNDYIDCGNGNSLNITNEITIEAWIKPGQQNFTQNRYVVSDYQDGYNVEILSYVDNNNITYGSENISLDSGETGTILAADISPGTIINGTGPFEATFDSGRVDMPVPESFAGTEFVYDTVRGDMHYLYFCAPFGAANISFYNDSEDIVGTLNLTLNQCGDFTHNFTTDWYYINSTEKVLAQMDQNLDAYVLYPMTNDLWGIDSGTFYGVGEDGTNVTYYTSDGDTGTNIRNFGYQGTITGSGDQGTGPADHLVANQSALGAIQQADGDGSESTSFYPYKELSHVFAIPMNAQYIAIATTQPNTTCYMRYANGSIANYQFKNGTLVNQSTGGTENYPYPNKIYVGNGTDNTPAEYINKGTFFICDALVYAYYEEDGADDEANMWGLKDPGIVFKPGSYGLAFSPSGKVDGYINGKGLSADASSNEWHHVVLTYNSSHINLYVDGIFSDSDNLTGDILPSQSNLTIGKYGNEHFNG
ncbi:MAG: BNR-4 repeat-containing protein, partial [Candidatus Aenigmarchaeota archaeon]|nr:BNR-4 repeat-containing protein [Candidatus Aenigmarchaeota archaeon]